MADPGHARLLRGGRKDFLATAAFLAIGLGAAHHPILLSGFRETQGNLGDARYLNYLLEHTYRWAARSPAHDRLWDPPIFHPALNTFAYSETLLGAAPIYWLFRAVTFRPDSAFQLWLLAVSCLNFLGARLLLKRGLRFDVLPSCFGAFLYAFASARIAHVGHPQLLPAFYPPLAILALCRILEPAAASRPRRERLAWVGLLAGALVAQAYTCVYTAWFHLLGLAIGGVVALLIPACRRAILLAFRLHALELGAGIALAILALLPLGSHYLRAGAEVGYRDYSSILPLMPRLSSWVHPGPGNWLYGWMSRVPPFRDLPTPYEQALGFGLLTTAAAVAGLFLRRASPGYRVLGLSALATILLATLWPGGVSLWRIVFAVVPGADALRAVARVGNVLLLPVAIGAAAFVQSVPWNRWKVGLTVVVCLLEQGVTTETYDKERARADVAEIVKSVDRRASAFFYSVIQPGVPDWAESVPIKYHVDAIWAQLDLGIPTINGYSGHAPPGWAFKTGIVARTPGEHERLALRLQEWLSRNGLDPARVAWVTADLRR